MANPTDVLHQLQVKLDHNYVTGNIKVNVDEDEELDEDIGQTSTLGFASSNISNAGGKEVDVDDAEAADKPYVTHMGYQTAQSDHIDKDDTKIKIETLLATFEQEMPEEAPPEETAAPPEGGTPPEVPQEAPPEGGEEMAPDAGMEAGMPGGEMPGGDMAGMGGEEEIKSASEIGRIYELKKIYTRLTTIESYLSDSSEPDLLRVRLLVSKSIELFEILSANIPSYKPPKAEAGTLDEIIIMYYKFLDKIYETVANHYKEQNTKLTGDGLNKATIAISNKELV